MTEGDPSFNEYHRQGMVCLTLANLSPVPDVQNRWLLMAQTWFRLAVEPPSHSDFSNVVQLKSR